MVVDERTFSHDYKISFVASSPLLDENHQLLHLAIQLVGSVLDFLLNEVDRADKS